MMMTLEASNHVIIAPNVVLEEQMSTPPREDPNWRDAAKLVLQVSPLPRITTTTTHSLMLSSFRC